MKEFTSRYFQASSESFLRSIIAIQNAKYRFCKYTQISSIRHLVLFSANKDNKALPKSKTGRESFSRTSYQSSSRDLSFFSRLNCTRPPLWQPKRGDHRLRSSWKVRSALNFKSALWLQLRCFRKSALHVLWTPHPNTTWIVTGADNTRHPLAKRSTYIHLCPAPGRHVYK